MQTFNLYVIKGILGDPCHVRGHVICHGQPDMARS